MKVSANEAILTKSINDVSIVRTEVYIWPTIITACIDPEAQTITRTLSVDKLSGGASITLAADLTTAGFTWDPIHSYLSFDFSDASQVDTYTITMTCNDGFYPDNAVVTFVLHALPN